MSSELSSTSAKGKQSSASWCDRQKQLLLECIKEELIKGEGQLTDSGFKTVQWKSICSAFNNKKGGEAYTSSQLHNQYHYQKRKYAIFKKLKEQSGFGWLEESQMVTADPTVWKPYLEAHPEAKEFRNKSLQFYELLNEIFEGKVATGKNAIASSSISSNLNHHNETKQNDDIENNISEVFSPIVTSDLSNNTDSNGSSKADTSQCKKRKRTNTNEEVIQLLNQIREDNISSKASKDNTIKDAIALFLKNFSDIEGLDGSVKLKIKLSFRNDPKLAESFIKDLDDEDRVLFVKGFIQ